MSEIRHGGDLIANVLARWNVPYVFTLCGGHISPILVGCETRGIKVIDCRDEKNAVFAADAVARMTGIPGVAAVTAGPGVTNSLTALKNAQMAQSPLVLFGGATATILKGRGALQDIDQMSLIESAVKWKARCSTVARLVPMLERAMKEATSGVPGPVFLEVPVDVLYPEAIVRYAGGVQAVVTAEEHSVIGGIGSAVVEALRAVAHPSVEFVGVPDTFGVSAEGYNELLEHFALTAGAVANTVRTLLKGVGK